MDYHDSATTFRTTTSNRHELREGDDSELVVEISEFNPQVQRLRGGVWNEHVLHVLEWEAAEHRVVLTQRLQTVLDIDTPVLRWARAKRDNVN